ncbi:magnesium and cobalt transport protein CorA [Stackebrandtia soli]|uniref:magnesium and cobalt transport protein CorA n=1 Tax=Stackebrandtia soli TaxID=1892856 RepID=UPI0039E8104A
MAHDWTCWKLAEDIEEAPDADPERFAVDVPKGSFHLLLISDPSAEAFAPVADALRLNHFARGDALSAHHRSKFDRYERATVIVIKTLWFLAETSDVETGDVVLIITDGALIIIRHGDRDPAEEAIAALRDADDRHVLSYGLVGIVYAIVDTVVRQYNRVAAELEEAISEVERFVLSEDRVDMVGRIYSLYREALEFREAVLPLMPVTEDVLDGRLDGNTKVGPYFRSVTHDAKRVASGIDGTLQLLQSILDAHLGQIGMWQNEDMRKISAWAAIIAAPTMIGGIYGMNFRHMPELKWAIGYPLALALMALVCFLLYRGFRRNGWL